MNVANQLAVELKRIGVTHAFGIPGGPAIPYMEAFKNNDIRVITVGNEQSAGIMADMFGRFTQVPGVCFATFGPGATNLSSGVGTAYLDRSPLLAFSSELPVVDQGRKIQMNVDHQKIFEPVTKLTTRLNGETFYQVLDESLKVSLAEMPGPVHIGLPTNVAKQEVTEERELSLPQEKPVEEAVLREELVEQLLQAKKPVLILGLSAARLLERSEVRAFIDKNPLPVVLSPMAKELLMMDHDKYVGVLFHASSTFVANVYRQADLILGLGYDSIEFNYEAFMPNVPLVHLDSEEADVVGIDQVFSQDGDLRRLFNALKDVEFPENDWDFDWIKANKQAMFDQLNLPQTGLSPTEALHVIRDVYPDDTILTLDVGAHTHLFGQAWDPRDDGKFVMTNGWSTMGFAIPAALGCKLAQPERPVVAVLGDGCFLMNNGELFVAQRENIPFVTVVFVDGDYSLIKVKQSWQSVPHYQTKVGPDEFFKADHFLGLKVFRATTKEELNDALVSAIALNHPAIVEVAVDGALYETIIVKDHK